MLITLRLIVEGQLCDTSQALKDVIGSFVQYYLEKSENVLLSSAISTISTSVYQALPDLNFSCFLSAFKNSFCRFLLYYANCKMCKSTNIPKVCFIMYSIYVRECVIR